MNAIVMQPAQTKKKLKGEDVGIPVRPLGQQYTDDIPEFWFKNNAFLSLFFTGFSANLPPGEEQFMYSVRLFQDKITEPVLQAQVKAFIGQEAHHSKEHEALNNCMERKGYDLKEIDARMRTFNDYMRKQTPASQLADTVCGEHITALMADYLLAKHPEVFDEMHPSLAKIWVWHAIEETEHKAVAFDVYDQIVGDRNLLRIKMAQTTVFFFGLNTMQAFKMMRRSGQMSNLKMWREAGSFLFGMMRELRKDYMKFYNRDFHPWQHDNRNAVESMKNRYLGATA